MEHSTLKCIYEFTDCAKELDCTECDIKKEYYRELYGKQEAQILVEPEHPVLIIAQ